GLGDPWVDLVQVRVALRANLIGGLPEVAGEVGTDAEIRKSRVARPQFALIEGERATQVADFRRDIVERRQFRLRRKREGGALHCRVERKLRTEGRPRRL